MDPTDGTWKTKAPGRFQARFETSKGDFVLEVRRGWAPLGADRFYNLVRHGFYDNQRFTRVVAGYIAQFGIHGDPKITAVWKNQTIPDDPVLQSNKRGFIGYAMTGPNTRSTQVYINLADNSRLDGQGFAPFGLVKEGMDTGDKIYSGYGENAGGGMRAGRQGPVETGGNDYLDREYPLLDSIVHARIIA
jgi:homoserine O-acetyltransferase/O-succinyltransferase